jgi:hypothetical protein
MMKTSTSPRRLYVRNAIVHLCFDGRYFGATAATEMNMKLPVTCVKLPSDGGRSRVEVTQKRPGQTTLVEVWRSCSITHKNKAA